MSKMNFAASKFMVYSHFSSIYHNFWKKLMTQNLVSLGIGHYIALLYISFISNIFEILKIITYYNCYRIF